MGKKRFILNADDFGMTNEINRAVVEGYNADFLKSASICANGEAFDSAVNEILPECQNLCIASHLNIIEGKSLLKKTKFLTDLDGNFKNGFIKLLMLSENKEFLKEVEAEFRLQIEKLANYTKINHIDSHVHTHGIPKLFELACKLAKEYGIPYVRTQFEHPYSVGDVSKYFNTKYPVNWIKVGLLNTFTMKNRETLKKYELKTNDYLIGVGYTGLMDSEAIEYGLKALINKDNIVAEALIHPSVDSSKSSQFKEYSIVKNLDLKDKISRLGFELTNYMNL